MRFLDAPAPQCDEVAAETVASSDQREVRVRALASFRFLGYNMKPEKAEIFALEW